MEILIIWLLRISKEIVIYLTSAESGTFPHETAGQAVNGRERRFPHVLGTTFFLRIKIFIKLKESV